jgi:hypothetical protein
MDVTNNSLLRIDNVQPYFKLSEWEWQLEQRLGVRSESDFHRPDAKTKAVKALLNKKPGIFDSDGCFAPHKHGPQRGLAV